MRALLFSIVLGAAAGACSRPAVEQAAAPERPAARVLDDGIQFYDLENAGSARDRRGRIWLYLPAGSHARASLPAILVAPAGSNLVTGMRLAEGDRPEHLPYVRAGFAVVGYELAGPMPDALSDEGVTAAVRAYIASRGGVLDAVAALEYVSASVPEIDLDRIYAAGHSSAAVVALILAAVEPRIKASAAYAPVIDVADRLGAQSVRSLTAFHPEMPEFLRWTSPSQHTDELCRKPIFLFSARNDLGIDQAVAGYADAMVKNGCPTTLRRVDAGGHYNSMIAEGVPAGVDWLRSIDRRGR